jgi:hypothetical protein
MASTSSRRLILIDPSFSVLCRREARTGGAPACYRVVAVL